MAAEAESSSQRYSNSTKSWCWHACPRSHQTGMHMRRAACAKACAQACTLVIKAAAADGSGPAQDAIAKFGGRV
eukprot:5089218-Pleurochrysis_carterae.AAC.1